MAHPRLTVENAGGSTQVSIEDLLQLTLLDDGTIQIDLAGKDVEVSRNGLRYIVSRGQHPILSRTPQSTAASV